MINIKGTDILLFNFVYFWVQEKGSEEKEHAV